MNPFHIICWILLGAAALVLIVWVIFFIIGVVVPHRRKKQIHAWRRTIKVGTPARFRNMRNGWTKVMVRWIENPKAGVAYEDHQCGVEWDTGVSTGSRSIEIGALYPREGETI